MIAHQAYSRADNFASRRVNSSLVVIISTLMKKTITLIIFMFCLSCILISCTKEKQRPTALAIQIITENYYVYEPNPIYLDKAKNLNELFIYALNNRNKLESTERKNIYSKSMSLYEENNKAESALEDAVDENRLMIRKSITMSTAALVSEPKEALKYFERAKESLNEDGKTSESMEDVYAALLVLEGVYLFEHKLLNDAERKDMISTINNFSTLSKKSKESFIGVIKEFK
jgi:hypothetical protein